MGRCYELSFQYAQNNTGWVLVHGYISDRMKGRVIDHAWVEKGDTVLDPVLDKQFPKLVYYSLYKAEDVKRYSYQELNKMAVKYETYGPWHKIDNSKIKW